MQIMLNDKITLRPLALVQGETGATTLAFSLPARSAGCHLAALRWQLRATNIQTLAYMAAELEPQHTDGERFLLPWTVTAPFTMAPGPLRVTLCGTEGESVVAKFLLEGVTVAENAEAKAFPGAGPNYFEMALLQMNENAAEAATGAQTAGEAAERARQGAGEALGAAEAAAASAMAAGTAAQAGVAAADNARLIAGGLHPGADLSVAFAGEIAAAPYGGDVWAWIRGRIRAGNFAGLHVGDYIPFTTLPGSYALGNGTLVNREAGCAVRAEIAGMDTYYRYGQPQVPHHIDFVSRNCWPDSHPFNKAAFNNGTTVSPLPWMAGDMKRWLNSEKGDVPGTVDATPTLVSVDYLATGVYDKLPAALRNVIVQKRLMVSRRYTAGSLRTSDDDWGWADIGKLWLPTEAEICGYNVWGTRARSCGGQAQYPLFAHNMKRVKGPGDNTRSRWWTLVPQDGSGGNFCVVDDAGVMTLITAANANDVYAPVCFRVA